MFAEPKRNGCSCLHVLLSLIAVLLAGIFVCLAGLVVTLVPALHAARPVMESIDIDAVKGNLSTVGAVLTKADDLLDDFSIEDLQIVPSDLAGLLLSFAATDVAPLAANITSVTTSMITAITNMDLKTGGDTFAGVATYTSAVQSVATILKNWVPAVDGQQNMTMADPSADPWHGLPSMIFGKSPVGHTVPTHMSNSPIQLIALRCCRSTGSTTRPIRQR